jgi:hypothetical protein
MESGGEAAGRPSDVLVREAPLAESIVMDEEGTVGAGEVLKEVEQRIARHGRIV